MNNQKIQSTDNMKRQTTLKMESEADRKIFERVKSMVKDFWEKDSTISRFFRYFMVGNFVTIIQFITLPILQIIFKRTSLINVDFHFLGPIGESDKVAKVLTNGTVVYDPYYVYNFTAGTVGDSVYRTYNNISGQYLSHGGLGFFLAMFITLLIAQVLTFIMQRKIVFKSNSSLRKAIFWFTVATVFITLGQNAIYGLYQPFIYDKFGENTGGIIASFTQAIIAFWVFYPIFKFIFKEKDESNKTFEHQN